MSRFLAAFVRLRWWSLRNSFRLAFRLGRVETLSRFAEIAMLPVLVLLFLPFGVLLGVLAYAVGVRLPGSPEAAAALELVGGMLLLTASIAVVLAPLFRTSEGTGAAPARLRLLPIPDGALHALTLAGAAADPWVLVVLPALVLLPVGLFSAGAPGAALLGLLAGLLLALVLAALRALASSLFQLLLRDRRRAELAYVALFAGLILFPALASLGIVNSELTLLKRGAATDPAHLLPAWCAALPSELYVRSVAAGAAGEPAVAVRAAALLGLLAIGLLTLSRLAHDRVLLGAGGAARRGPARPARFRLPGIPPPIAALAHAEERQTMRTVNGRILAYVLPALVPASVFLIARSSVLPGHGLQRYGTSFTLAALLYPQTALIQVMVNQYAVHGRGLTRQLLSPLSDLELVTGKALGELLLAARMALVSLAYLLLLAPLKSFELVAGGLLVALSTQVLLAPGAACLAMLLPRMATPGRFGSPGAHPAAFVLGLLLFLVLMVPPLGLLIGGRLISERWPVGLVLVAGWTVVAALLCRVLLPYAADLLASRRETLHLATLSR